MAQFPIIWPKQEGRWQLYTGQIPQNKKSPEQTKNSKSFKVNTILNSTTFLSLDAFAFWRKLLNCVLVILFSHVPTHSLQMIRTNRTVKVVALIFILQWYFDFRLNESSQTTPPQGGMWFQNQTKQNKNLAIKSRPLLAGRSRALIWSAYRRNKIWRQSMQVPLIEIKLFFSPTLSKPNVFKRKRIQVFKR